MSNFLQDDGKNKFSATLAFRNGNANLHPQILKDQNQAHHKILDDKTPLPTLQRTNTLPPGSSIIQNLQIKSPLKSRLKSPVPSSSSSSSNTTPGKRLNALDIIKNSRIQSQKAPLRSTVVPSKKLEKSAAVNSDIVDLSSSDDNEDADDILMNYKPKYEKNPTLSSIPLQSSFRSTPSSSSAQPTQKETKSNMLNSLSKFSYNSDKDSDDSDDDDIIITGFSTANKDSSFTQTAPPKPTTTNNTFPVKREAYNPLKKEAYNPVKRDASIPVKRELSVDDAELARKRQQILENKKLEVERNFLREQERQKMLDIQAKLEEERLEKLRIDKLLEKYKPLKRLPEKYQLKFPVYEPFDKEIEPQLPNTVSELESTQDNIANLPQALQASVFRQQNIKNMHSLVYRINIFTDLHKRMDSILKSAAQMRNQVDEKAKLTRGNMKADIRYNQILRFFDSKIKTLSKLYGEVGMHIDDLRDLKKDLLVRARLCEDIRQQVLFHGFANKNLIEKDYENRSMEIKLILSTIHEMFKFSSVDSEDMKPTLRYFTAPQPSYPKIKLIESQRTSEMFKPLPSIDDDFSRHFIDQNDDDIFMSETPFGRERETMSNFGMNRLNPYGGDMNDTEGIKNLMESIKVTEIEEEGLATTPDDLCISLLKHQRIGLSWMLKIEAGKSRGGILADDMGLGKTVQALSLIVANKSTEPNRKLNLIVGPVTLLRQWEQEIKMKIKTDKQMSTFLFHSNNKLRTFEEFSKYDIILVSYQTLSSEWKKHYAKELEMAKHTETFRRNVVTNRKYVSPFYSDDSIFYRIILDEAQYIKNRNTMMSRSVASLSSKYKWCLSGTPIQNRIDELYPIIRFLNIGPYNVWSKFNTHIVKSIKNNRISGTQKVHAILSAILLRRTKDSEIDGKPILQLPQKHIIEEKVEMGKKEKEYYNELEHSSKKTADRLLNSTNSKAYSSILTLLLRLRQICDHHYLVKLGDEGDRVERLESYTQGWKVIQDYSDTTVRFINNQQETGFVCMHCSDEMAPSQIMLLSKCGHPVCKDCHLEYFQENTETETPSTITARCTECSAINVMNMSVHFPLYEAYTEGLTWPQVRKKFELDSKASNKNWRLDAIRKYIAHDGGLFVSAKITKAIEIIENVMQKSPGEKVIVFSQFLGFFDILSIKLREKRIKFLQYDGSMDMTAKNDVVNAFYKDPDVTVLLLSLKAGNVGLTLTCANHVILTEPFWNPYVEKQAQDRVHRISQTKEVHIHRLLIQGTVEDRIMTLQKEKEELVESALDPSARNKIVKLSRRELGFLFGLNGLANLEDD